MGIKHKPVSKQYILQCLNPLSKKSKRRKHERRQAFSWFRSNKDSEYFEFCIVEKLGGETRPEHAVLNGGMIDNIEKEYEFCSVSTHDEKGGLTVICRRDRWNECDYCKRVLWQTRRNETMQRFCNIKFYNNKSLCPRCYKQVKKNE